MWLSGWSAKGSSLGIAAIWSCFSIVPSSTPAPTLVKSQLVRLQPVGFLNLFFYLNYLFQVFALPQ